MRHQTKSVLEDVLIVSIGSILLFVSAVVLSAPLWMMVIAAILGMKALFVLGLSLGFVWAICFLGLFDTGWFK